MSVSITGRQLKAFFLHLDDTSNMWVDASTICGTINGNPPDDDDPAGHWLDLTDRDRLVITFGSIRDGDDPYDSPIVGALVPMLKKHFCKM